MKNVAMSFLVVVLALLVLVLTELMMATAMAVAPPTWDLTGNLYLMVIFPGALIANLIVLFPAKKVFATMSGFRIALFGVALLVFFGLYLNATGNPMIELGKYVATIMIAFAIVALTVFRRASNSGTI